MKRKSRLHWAALAGSLWLVVLVTVVMASDSPRVQAKESGSALPEIQNPSLSDHGPMSVTQVSPLQVLSGPLPDIPADYMIVEGDIQIPKSDFASRYSSGQVGRGQADRVTGPNGTFVTNRWSNGIVPYEFDANVTAANQTAAQQAMTDWQAIANVQFTQCANNSCSGDYVHIQFSNANNSAVGRRGGRQVINLVSWDSRYTIAHELGHTLGFEHEQSRPDRNSFIQINYNNVCKATDASCNGGFCFDGSGNRIDCDFNFDIVTNALTYGAYDFDSVMHYPRDGFSRNGNDTITVLPPNDTQWQDAIGQRTHLSQDDQNAMGCLYPFSNWRWVSTTPLPIQTGDCLLPYSGFGTAFAATPSGGMLWIEPGSYAAIGTYNKAVTLKTPNGPVVLGQ